MVIIVGGSSHTGKTLLSQRLVKKLGYSYLSLDNLRNSLNLTGDNYERIRFLVWPVAADLIKKAIDNNENLIAEGCFIPYNWKESFTPYYLNQIKCCFLLMSSGYITKNFDKIKEFACVAEKRENDNPDMNRLISCSIFFKEDCLKNGTDFYETDEVFDIEKMEKYVLEGMNEK